MEGEDLQSKISDILKENKVNPIQGSNKFDILHQQTAMGADSQSKPVNKPATNPNIQNSLVKQTPIVQPITQNVLQDNLINENLNKIKLNIIKDSKTIPNIDNYRENAGENKIAQTNVETNTATNQTPNKVFQTQKSIRTYESDVAEALSKKKTTVASMVIAENSKGSDSSVIGSKEKSNFGKNFIKVILSLIFISAGALGAYLLYQKSPLAKQEVAKQESKVPSVVSANAQKVVALNSLNKKSLTAFLNTNLTRYDIPEGEIYEIIPAITTEASTTIKLGAKRFIEIAGFDITDTLKRSITDRWMLGVYSTDGKKVPFIILTNDFFQNAYAGMLKWESTIADEFIDIFNYRNIAYRIDDTSTSTITTYFNIKGSFEDKIIRNRDVRQFRTQYGDLLILYTFIDKNTILITNSEAVIPEIIDRIEKQTYIR